MNREGMPNADFSSWTPCGDLAEQIVKWYTNFRTKKRKKNAWASTSEKGRLLLSQP